jgi:hypothetical protein
MKQDHAVWINREVLTGLAFIFVLGLAATPVFAEEEIHWDSGSAAPAFTPMANTEATPIPSPEASSAPAVSTASTNGTVTSATGMAAPTTSEGSDSDLDESDDSTATPTDSSSEPTALATTPTPVAASAKPSPVLAIVTSPVATAAPTPISVQGVLKMKDVYALGMKYYAKDDYVEAIKYLKQALTVHDPYTPKFYYAEDNAMLGVIYQFHIIHTDLAYQYYDEALKIDPTTDTAKKHISEVKPDQN